MLGFQIAHNTTNNNNSDGEEVLHKQNKFWIVISDIARKCDCFSYTKAQQSEQHASAFTLELM